jgi:hypothetical protein
MTIHLAIMREPYLSMLIDGRKKCESRFSLHKIAPFDQVKPRDEIYFKKSGGKVVAKGIVNQVLCIKLQGSGPLSPQEMFRKYNNQICATPEFIAKKLNAKYATLIWFEKIERIEPLTWCQTGQQAWISDWDIKDAVETLTEQEQRDLEVEDEIDEQIRDMAIEENAELLEEEKAKRNQDGWKYRYQCSHCSFQSEFFHEVTKHMILTKKCREAEQKSPCYPILIHQPKGAPIP